MGTVSLRKGICGGDDRKAGLLERQTDSLQSWLSRDDGSAAEGCWSWGLLKKKDGWICGGDRLLQDIGEMIIMEMN